MSPPCSAPPPATRPPRWLLGLREDTGQLTGYGPIPAGMARELAADAQFQRLVYDPVTGYLLDYKSDRYRLPAALDRFCAMRDRHCRFPGATQPAHLCDNEHTHAFDQGGPTSAANIVNLSRFAHRAKTHGDYQTHQDPDGTLHWTTPLGRHYTTHPWDYRPESER
ncbi:hypothetical protein acdb102_33860 [Acidothermaceae bacterium B102]|nr:hypothetical protein acdb102_33860 [Acidothermaceae bacterium B102]